MTIQFNSNFKHTDWVDNLDRVQASGSNGFNIRFQGLLSDMAVLSTVIGQINDELNGLTAPKQPTPITRTFGPALVPQNYDPSLPPPSGGALQNQNVGWMHSSGFASLPSQRTNAEGVMAVTLPDQAVIQNLRVYGKNATISNSPGAGIISVKLLAQPFNDTGAQQIAVISGSGTSAFGTTAKAITTNGVNVVKIDTFHYFLDVQVLGAGTNDSVAIFSFQIDYVSA